MIPQEHSTAVNRALIAAFGVPRFEDIRDLTERPGSNRAFRIIVRGSAYLLRINTRLGDMARQYTCMQAASDAGLAPLVHYANAGDRVSITDFVEAVPFSQQDALVRIPAMLRALHALPAFPQSPYNTTCTFLLTPGPMLDGFLQKFRASSPLPENQTSELFNRYAQIAALYKRLDPDPVPCHNDLFKPDNMLFDGKRLWLVDWEAAFQNDRYADLAVVANMIANHEAEEAVYLQEYFGGLPTDYQRARLYLMRQLAHMFYAMAFSTQGSAAAAHEHPAPDYRDFQQRFWNREIGLADDEARTLFGKVHCQQLWHNIQQPRFDEALQLLSEQHTT